MLPTLSTRSTPSTPSRALPRLRAVPSAPAGAALALLALLVAAGGARAADAPADADARQRAAAAFGAGSWQEAAEGYQAIVDAHPEDAQATFRLGVSRLKLGEPRPALELLERARALGSPVPQVAFRVACAHALLGDRDAAFAALAEAAAAGFPILALLDGEPLLAPLREDPRWAGTRAAVERNQFPCRTDPKFREFDFWLGEWDVRPNGAPPTQPPAENVVTLEQDGCVVHEHWNAPGSNGQSFNLWDRSRGHWYQTWVSNTGSMHEYEGGLDEQGNMVYRGEIPAPTGTARVTTRLTFFRLGPDRVRQFSEQSTDGGATWQVAYDLIYERRPGTKAPTRP